MMPERVSLRATDRAAGTTESSRGAVSCDLLGRLRMARRAPVDGLSLEALGLDAHETAAYLSLLATLSDGGAGRGDRGADPAARYGPAADPRKRRPAARARGAAPAVDAAASRTAS